RRWCRAPAGHDGRQDAPAGARGAGAVEVARRPRLAPVDRADALRGPGGDLRHRRRGRQQRRPVRRGHSRQQAPRARRRPRRLSRAANRGRPRPPRSAHPAALMSVGIVGAGQLGRMLALAGYPLGLDFLCLDPARDAPAGQVAPLLNGAFSDRRLLKRLARECEVVTFDWENVPVASLETIARVRGARFCRPPRALATGQDRVAEKRLFERLAIPTTRWRAVGSARELTRAVRELGLPGVLKTRRLGYDGKGQAVLRSAADV